MQPNNFQILKRRRDEKNFFFYQTKPIYIHFLLQSIYLFIFFIYLDAVLKCHIKRVREIEVERKN